MEFEVAGVANEKARTFQKEVDAKYNLMNAFKRTWGKFALHLEGLLKKNDFLTEI